MEMIGRVDKFKKDLGALRTGRASAALLDPVHIEYYGSKVPLKQIAAISIPEARTIEVRPWDASSITAIEQELRKVDFGSSPVRNGNIIRINLPPMTEDQRKKMVKVVSSMGEENRVHIRNIRRDALEKVKKALKASEITEDDRDKYTDSVQKLTDSFISQIDNIAETKEKDLMTV